MVIHHIRKFFVILYSFAVGIRFVDERYLLLVFHCSNIGDAIFFLIFAIIFESGFAFSWRTVPWLYCAELFDIQTRGRCIGVTTAFHFLLVAIMECALLQLDLYVPTPDVLAFFVSTCALTLPLVYFFVPETANKTASEVGQEFVNFKSRCLRLDWGP